MYISIQTDYNPSKVYISNLHTLVLPTWGVLRSKNIGVWGGSNSVKETLLPQLNIKE